MLITCSNCNSSYNLSGDQISGLKHSILPCSQCRKLIKIAICPHCRAFYSITFSTALKSRYSLKCEKCSNSFIIDFPVVKDPHKTELPANKPTYTKETKKDHSSIPQKRYTRRDTPLSSTHDQSGRVPQTTISLTLKQVFHLAGTAFSKEKLITAAIGIFILFISLFIYQGALHIFTSIDTSNSNVFVNSFINIFPLVIVFFFFIHTSSLIAKITFEEILGRKNIALRNIFSWALRSVPSVFISNIILLIIANMLLILFGKIPLVGPLFFALLFLPIYAISLAVILIVFIGFWFYPPIIAQGLSADGLQGGKNHALRLIGFIRKHNLSLIYIIPILMIVSALVFSGIYIIHYGSFSLSVILARGILDNDGVKIFSAVPSTFLQISDMAFFGSYSGLFKSLVSNQLFTFSIGGFIIGLMLSGISIFLFSSFISITATLSTHVFLMMEKGRGIEDKNKINLLIILSLILFIILIAKKIFF